MHRYFLYGLHIISQIELPGLIPGFSTQIDIKIAKKHISPKNGGFIQRIKMEEEIIAICQIINGRNVNLQVNKTTTDEQLRPYLLGTIMGILLHQRGLFPLHGNAIDTPEGCLIFVAESGIGKSTLAATFFKKGFSILNDDISPIDYTHVKPCTLPGYPYLRLLKDALTKLNYSTKELRRIELQPPKYIFPTNQQYGNKPRPIKAILELKLGNTFSITPIHHFSEKYTLIHHHTYRLQYINLLNLGEQHFEHCRLGADHIPCYTVTRPQNEENPEKLFDFIAKEFL